MIQYADHLEEEVIAKADHIGYLNLQITELQTKYTALVNKIINLKWWQSIERIYWRGKHKTPFKTDNKKRIRHNIIPLSDD